MPASNTADLAADVVRLSWALNIKALRLQDATKPEPINSAVAALARVEEVVGRFEDFSKNAQKSRDETPKDARYLRGLYNGLSSAYDVAVALLEKALSQP